MSQYLGPYAMSAKYFLHSAGKSFTSVYHLITQNKYLYINFIQKYKESLAMQIIILLFLDTKHNGNNVWGYNRNLQLSELHCCLAQTGTHCCDVLEHFSAPGLRGINSLRFQVTGNNLTVLRTIRLSLKSTPYLSIYCAAHLNYFLLLFSNHIVLFNRKHRRSHIENCKNYRQK